MRSTRDGFDYDGTAKSRLIVSQLVDDSVDLAPHW
jgi:hypothetical protein